MNWYKLSSILNIEQIEEDSKNKTNILSSILSGSKLDSSNMRIGFHLNTLLSRALQPWSYLKYRNVDKKKAAYFYIEWLEYIKKAISNIPKIEQTDARTGTPLDVLAPARNAFGALFSDTLNQSSLNMIIKNITNAKNIAFDLFGKERIRDYKNFLEILEQLLPEETSEILNENIREYNQQETGIYNTTEEEIQDFVAEQQRELSPSKMRNIIRSTVYPYPIDWIEYVETENKDQFALKIEINDIGLTQKYYIFVRNTKNAEIKGIISFYKVNEEENIKDTISSNSFDELSVKIGEFIKNIQKRIKDIKESTID